MPNCAVCKDIITPPTFYKGDSPKCLKCRSIKNSTVTKPTNDCRSMCIVCDKWFYATKGQARSKCGACKNRHNMYCHGCRRSIIITSYGSPYGRIYHCDKCKDIIKKIRDKKNTYPTLFNPKYDIRVEFEKKQEDHDGYCSGTDSDDIRTSTSKIVHRFPCLKTIKRCDVDGDFNITNPDIISMYNMDDEPHGNGYCGCSTSYYIKSIQVVPAVNFPF